MKILLLLCAFLSGYLLAFGQEDSLKKGKQIEQVTITQQKGQEKTDFTESLERVLQKQGAIELIQRGAYGSEILLNGMSTERSVITLDGMRIHSACTDKMDPITSYMDRNNIQSIQINSGSKMSAYGSSIAGNVLLKSANPYYGAKKTSGNVFTGVATNNGFFSSGGQLVFSSPRIYLQPTFSFRRAGDYKDGSNKRLAHSGYAKWNGSTKLGVKVNDKSSLESYALIDYATNIGYPALPMDVRLAQLLLFSQAYKWSNGICHDHPMSFEAKIYFNSTKHIMDDSKRTNVPIRMDMPGQTHTTGYLTDFEKRFANSSKLGVKLNGFWNQSIAEMTMYPDGEYPDMYMYTWPNIHTINNNLSVQYTFQTGKEHWWNIGGGLQHTFYTFGDSLGYHTTTIFHPEVTWSQQRLNSSFFISWVKNVKEQHLFTIQMGYSDRAPSISEAFGFYLFNSYDRYDYVGNPFLKNENSVNGEINYTFTSKNKNHIVSFRGAYFHIQNYIYGRILDNVYPMTIGGSGVKEYTQMPFADQMNIRGSYTLKQEQIYEGNWSIQYSYGKGKGNIQLPFIAPIQVQWHNQFNVKGHLLSLAIQFHSTQRKVGTYFGELPTESWYSIDLSWEKTFQVKSHQLTAKAGVENLTNQYYSTFSDWNKVPRIGRNFNFQLMYSF